MNVLLTIIEHAFTPVALLHAGKNIKGCSELFVFIMGKLRMEEADRPVPVDGTWDVDKVKEALARGVSGGRVGNIHFAWIPLTPEQLEEKREYTKQSGSPAICDLADKLFDALLAAPARHQGMHMFVIGEHSGFAFCTAKKDNVHNTDFLCCYLTMVSGVNDAPVGRCTQRAVEEYTRMAWDLRNMINWQV